MQAPSAKAASLCLGVLQQRNAWASHGGALHEVHRFGLILGQLLVTLQLQLACVCKRCMWGRAAEMDMYMCSNQLMGTVTQPAP